ncbi:MAG TPA: carbonic anhydrase [Pyrinomonadaceae bacterium]|jgi:carbonic anhydrase|nr:carbonic anhydrase [Pyrinomonadaceae bacterium]
MTDDGVHLIDFAAHLKDLKKAEVLLLTCMDFRFFEQIARVMRNAGFEGKYDHVILAGAALGAVVPVKEHWHKTFFDHLELAEKLHHVEAVIVLEHRDCGAYSPKGFGLLPDNPTPEEERRVHFEQVAKLKEKIPSHLFFEADLLERLEKNDDLTFDQLM